jgi:pimeloyl-ACP methyl ester carboxylesterase
MHPARLDARQGPSHHEESAMYHLRTWSRTGATRARDGTARLRALGLAFFLCTPALAAAQPTGAGSEARPTPSREPVMTQLNTVDRPTAVPAPREAVGEDAIRPFRARVPDADVADMRRRLAATRFPDKETVGDASQGAQIANLRELVRYWATDYDWRNGEARLNAYPQFITRVDGVDIHFIHVKSRHPNAMPLIVAHGWPGSVFEQIKLIEPLTDPTKYGGRPEDAFDVVIPSLPGFGFSGRPTEAGWGLERIGRAFDVLMKRLGYTRYVAQGGDWGAGIVEAMGRQAPAGLLGIHTNFPAVITAEVGAALGGDQSALAALSEKERAAVRDLGAYVGNGGLSYLVMMGARPQAVGYGLTDSPAGLAGWMLVHSGFTKWSYGTDPTQSPSRDEVLDNFSLYWLTNTVASSARIYWENRGAGLTSAGDQKSAEVKVPVAITVFPDEIFRAQEAWARRAFPNVIYFHEADRGGHFAMWEYPELFASELRAAFRPLR